MVGTESFSSAVEQLEDLHSVVRRVVKALQAGRYSLAELSEALDSAENRLSRFVGGSRDLRIGELLKLLELIHVPSPLFLRLVLAELPVTPPGETIEFLCLPANAPPVPFLVEIRARLKEVGIPTGKGTRAGELAELDDLRFLGALAARRKLEEVCRELVSDYTAGSSSLLYRRELVHGIGLWATISRTLGEKAVAAQALALGFELASDPHDHLLRAMLKQRATYLVADFGHISFAFDFLREAAEYFAFEGLQDRLATCQLDRAILLVKKADWSLAESTLHSALALLPTTEWRNRVAAFHTLATCCERRGDSRSAQEWLARATAEYSNRRDALLGQLLWTSSRFAVESGDTETAIRQLREAMRILGELGQPLEAELVLVDLVEVRFSSNDNSSLRALGEELLGRLRHCSHSRIATDALVELGNELIWGKPSLELIRKSRSELARAGSLVQPPALTYR